MITIFLHQNWPTCQHLLESPVLLTAMHRSYVKMLKLPNIFFLGQHTQHGDVLTAQNSGQLGPLAPFLAYTLHTEYDTANVSEGLISILAKFTAGERL